MNQKKSNDSFKCSFTCCEADTFCSHPKGLEIRQQRSKMFNDRSKANVFVFNEFNRRGEDEDK